MCVNTKTLSILNIYVYNIPYFQCYCSALQGVLSFCLVRWASHADRQKTLQTCNTYMTDLKIPLKLKKCIYISLEVRMLGGTSVLSLPCSLVDGWCPCMFLGDVFSHDGPAVICHHVYIPTSLVSSFHLFHILVEPVTCSSLKAPKVSGKYPRYECKKCNFRLMLHPSTLRFSNIFLTISL
jgi:hypothetical protein